MDGGHASGVVRWQREEEAQKRLKQGVLMGRLPVSGQTQDSLRLKVVVTRGETRLDVYPHYSPQPAHRGVSHGYINVGQGSSSVLRRSSQPRGLPKVLRPLQGSMVCPPSLFLSKDYRAYLPPTRALSAAASRPKGDRTD
jgi:hypothetical protein